MKRESIVGLGDVNKCTQSKKMYVVKNNKAHYNENSVLI